MSRRALRDAGRARVHFGAGAPQSVQTAADVRSLLAAQITQLTANPDLDPLRVAGQLAQLARVALRAIELANLEARVQAVEAALRLRKEDQSDCATISSRLRSAYISSSPPPHAGMLTRSPDSTRAPRG